VTDGPVFQESARRYQLTTFGTLSLAGAERDNVLGEHGHHRRRLALLAVLAAAGDRGKSRDQLLLLFWPDAPQARARHSLDQLLYALRNSIDESVFAGVNPLRLNPDVIDSDVGAFNAALGRGDLQDAVHRYRGPFLDGFYLSEAPEFERWAETERARLAGSHTGALERLARSADDARELEAATRWWSALTEADPLSSRYAAGRIRALASAGEQGAALQFARRYEALVAEELDTTVDPAITALVNDMRTSMRDTRSAAPDAPSRDAEAERAAHVGTTRTTQPVPGEQPAVGGAPGGPTAAGRAARRRWVAPSIVALLVVSVVGATLLWKSGLSVADGTGPPAVASIAVVPFANVSGVPQDAALVNGLNEELISVLANLGKLRVIARSSASVFQTGDAAARHMADSLGVSHVLLGGVQTSGSRLRVQARLVDARDGSTRWAETYDRELRDVFAVQSEIAGVVARELDLRLGAGALARIQRGPTRSIAAYEFYLRGSDPALTRSDSGARAGVDHFRQAIALDSGYPAAYAGLSRMILRAGYSGDSLLSPRARLLLAEQAALKALELDDSLAEAHSSLAFIRRLNLDMPSAEVELKRAIALDPMNARLHEWMAQLYITIDQPALALEEARRAVELDPLSATTTAELAHALQANGRCDDALALLATLRSLRPPLLRAGSIASQCYAHKRMWPEALAEVDRISGSGGPRVASLRGWVLARAGRTEEARQILAELIERSHRVDGLAFDIAMIYGGLGDRDRAFEWIDRSIDERSLSLVHQYELLQGLKSDPRYDRMRQRLGIQKR